VEGGKGGWRVVLVVSVLVLVIVVSDVVGAVTAEVVERPAVMLWLSGRGGRRSGTVGSRLGDLRSAVGPRPLPVGG
jgi:hypothetical protein